jgi:hypothetical protein
MMQCRDTMKSTLSTERGSRRQLCRNALPNLNLIKNTNKSLTKYLNEEREKEGKQK